MDHFAMAIEITIPRLGWSMDEGVFVGWLKRDGDAVRAGDPLFTLQGDKATLDIESVDEGTLKIPTSAPAAGETVLVGAIIGYLLESGETEPAMLVSGDAVATERPSLATRENDRPISRRQGPRSSPLARRIASENGIDWTTLRGSGRSGRIRRADVLEAIKCKETSTGPHADSLETITSIPISPTRRTIASRIVASSRSTAPVTLTTTADVTHLVELRRQFKSAHPAGGLVPSFLDCTIKLTALAIHKHPLLNARWDEKADRIVLSNRVHIGIAVDTEAGLVVPVIRDAAELGLSKIAERAIDVVKRAKEQRLRPADMQGGTFTITNLGAFGVEFFTPIINLPECAILGMGKIERRPIFDADRVVGRDMMCLSLTFDHRVVDGAPAARFLRQLTQLIETPYPWLMA
jgi:pyruvate dehydrogenase E2 component (dihydrolipoamide acetyltransferase)